MKGHLLSLEGISRPWIEGLFRSAHQLKLERKKKARGRVPSRVNLKGKTLGLLFDKPSTRTRVSFEVAMVELGGATTFMQVPDGKLGHREDVRDVARTLSRYLSGLVVRTHSQHHVEELARYSSIPVINGLSDQYHPCQVLSDLFTVWEWKKRLKDVELAYVGDGNNVLHSLLLVTSCLGVNMRAAFPKGYGPKASILSLARKTAQRSGAQIRVGEDPVQAVKGAHIVYTDVWTSMGQEKEKKRRNKVFQPYQINNRLMKHAALDARVMHCLPAHRNEEITDSVIEGRQSIVFDQAENRLHIQKAILLKLLLEESKWHVDKK